MGIKIAPVCQKCIYHRTSKVLCKNKLLQIKFFLTSKFRRKCKLFKEASDSIQNSETYYSSIQCSLEFLKEHKGYESVNDFVVWCEKRVAQNT